MICVKCNNPLNEYSARCDHGLDDRTVSSKEAAAKPRRIVRRVVICAVVVFIAIGGFYFSLIATSENLTADQYAEIDRSIDLIGKAGFTAEAFYLGHLTAFRGSDNWLNSSVAKENAYAATNYPFAIITVYSDFFSYPMDDVERAAILLHEAKHVEGKDEKEAYKFVWKNKKALGWTADKYSRSIVFREIRNQTIEYSPELFVCDFNAFRDCSE
ncbi:MAG: hypothetical protein R2684_09550 [Pyrinomonadaceae bacterium]